MHSFRLDIKPSQQYFMLVSIGVVLLTLSCAIAFIPRWSTWSLITLLFSFCMAGWTLMHIRTTLYQPTVMLFSDDNCVIDDKVYQVAFHSFYLGDWFWLKLVDKTLANSQPLYIVLSPNMIEQPSKCQLKRCLKRINSAKIKT